MAEAVGAKMLFTDSDDSLGSADTSLPHPHCSNASLRGEPVIFTGYNCSNVAYQEQANNSLNSSSPVEKNINPFLMTWYLQLIYIVAFVTMVVVAAGGNAIVIWIVLAHKRMRTVTNYFLVNLALADFLMSVLNTLFNFVYMLHGNDWTFGRTYCKITQFSAVSTISASVFTFMAIAIDRYMAIIHPLKPRMQAVTVLGGIAVIWVMSITLAFPYLLFAEVHTWHYNDSSSRTVCYIEWPDGVFSLTDFWYSIFLMLVNYVVPLCALAGTYTVVGIELWGSQAIGELTAKQEESIQSKRKVVRMMIAVVVIFGVCWLPQHLFFIVSNRHPYISEWAHIQHVYLVIYWIAMSNSMYNPIIYCWMNARFRRGFLQVFRWLPCARRKLTQMSHPPGIRNNVNRTSMSESTKYCYDRNGSVNTQLDSMEESTYVSHQQQQPRYQYRGFTRVRKEENYL